MNSTRSWQHISEKKTLHYLLEKKLHDRSMYARDFAGSEFILKERRGDDFVFNYPPGLEFPEILTLIVTMQQHVEIDFETIKIDGVGRVFLKPLRGRISEISRRTDRIPVTGNFISVDNFQLSKSTLEEVKSGVKLGVSGRIILNNFEKRLSKEFPGLRIFDYSSSNLPDIIRYLKKDTRAVLIKDTSSPDTFGGHGEEFINYLDILRSEERIVDAIRTYTDAKVKSIMAMPLFFSFPDRVLIYAFMYCEAKEPNAFVESDLSRWKTVREEITQNFMSASSITIKERQTVLNFSEHGAAFHMTNDELIRLMPQQTNISFDLLVRMQAPLRINARVAHITGAGNNLVAGVHFSGFGHTYGNVSGEERLRTFARMAQSAR